MAGCVEGIRRALVLGLVLIAGTAIEYAPSVGPLIRIISTNIILLSEVGSNQMALLNDFGSIVDGDNLQDSTYPSNFLF